MAAYRGKLIDDGWAQDDGNRIYLRKEQELGKVEEVWPPQKLKNNGGVNSTILFLIPALWRDMRFLSSWAHPLPMNFPLNEKFKKKVKTKLQVEDPLSIPILHFDKIKFNQYFQYYLTVWKLSLKLLQNVGIL